MASGHDDAGDGAPLALAETAAGVSGPSDERSAGDALERGSRLGRYAIVAVRGRGGMGVVYEAYDPELDRKVALKVMRPDAEDLEKLRARFQREARAMARVSHPGIVPVHDVGRDGDRLFLSMELVDGDNARAWVERARPGWRAIVAAYLGAGRGLAAGHAAGIVHRDVKPENVLVDRHGHGRIGDFGLAQTMASVSETPAEGGPGAAAAPALDVTRAGEVVGTPAYMSPEQHRGDPVDARTDQFSFSIALWEALFGGRPFDEGASPSYESVRDAVLGSRMRPVPASKVPRWLRATLQRGLRVEPGERWPSLAAELDAIQSGLGRARRTGFALALGGAVAVAAVATVVAAGDDPGERGPDLAASCAEQGKVVDGVWTAERRDAVVAAAGAREAELLDRHAAALKDLRVARCMAPASETVRREQACLDRAVERLRGTVDDLAARRTTVAIVDPVGRCAGGDAPAYRPITTVDEIMVAPSPSGDEIAFLSGGRLVITDGSGKDVEAMDLKRLVWRIDWLPDPNRLVLSSRNEMTKEDEPILLVTRDPPGVVEITIGRVAAVSDDGTRVAFLRRDTLVVRRLGEPAGEEEVPLLPALGLDDVAWSVAGDRVAVCGMSRERRATIQVVELASGRVEDQRGLFTDRVGDVSCEWEPGGALLVSAATRTGNDAAIYALPFDAAGQRSGPIELRYAVPGREAVLGAPSARGTLIALRQVTSRGAVMTPDGDRQLTIRAGQVRISGVDPARRRVLLINKDGQVGWLDVDRELWDDLGHVDEGVLLAAEGERIHSLTRDGDALTIDAFAGTERTSDLPRRLEIAALSRVADFACGGDAPWRCVVLAEAGGRLIVADVPAGGEVRLHQTDLPGIVRNLALDAPRHQVAVGINETVALVLDLATGTWNREPSTCLVQRVRWALGGKPGLVTSGGCRQAWKIVRIDGTGRSIDLVQEWPSDFALLGPEEAFVLHLSFGHEIGWLDGL